MLDIVGNLYSEVVFFKSDDLLVATTDHFAENFTTQVFRHLFRMSRALTLHISLHMTEALAQLRHLLPSTIVHDDLYHVCMESF